MTYACIDWFAGIGCARLAFSRAGWACVWSCERDADARTVYARHFGHAPDAADILDVATGDIPDATVWVAGFPCQDLSVAGRRAGFDGDRSVLVFRLLQLASLVRPPWLLLENVPGLLSVRGGADFATLLCCLEDAGYMGAWRVLDARWFGVPQRRRRVFLLARRADADGPDPATVLLESARVRGGSAAGRAAREDVARPLSTGASNGGGHRVDLDHGVLVTALTAKMAQGTSGPARDEHHHLVADPISCTEGKTYSHEGAHNFRLRNIVAFDLAQLTHPTNRSTCLPDGTSPGPVATNRVHIASVAMRGRDGGGTAEVRDDGTANALRDGSAGGGSAPMVLATGVRRLMPIECERLQGLPDDWTTGHPDSIRYRLIGNGMAVPCVQWIASRLREALR